MARHIALVAGDVLLVGTPHHSRSVDAGDVVACGITGISRIEGTVTAIPAPRASALGFDERVPDRFKDNLRMAKQHA